MVQSMHTMARVKNAALAAGDAPEPEARVHGERGDIILQADADTIYSRDWLTRIHCHLTSHPEAIAVAGRTGHWRVLQ
jgi:D-inositol-3-phosphate glycosyltransferase